MDSFIKNVAEYYYNKLGNDIDNTIFVFESKRAKLFFRHYLSLLSKNKPIFSPCLETVNDFIISMEDKLELIDKTGLLFEFYKVYIDYSKDTKNHKFDRFIFWANIILSDFDLIDRYLVDTNQIFNNIRNYKKIVDDYSYLNEQQKKAIEMVVSSWISNEQNDFKQNFETFWKMLKPLYDKLKESLEKQGLMYEGAIYRRLAENENIISNKFKGNSKKIIFVGLFQMSKAQFEILKHMKKYCDVDFCWDENAKILEDQSSEAYKIMSKNKKELGYVDNSEWYFAKKDGKQNIKVIECSGKISEAKAINKLIEEMGVSMSNDTEINSAIILADENLLIPTVSSIPQEIQNINISIGYPLRNSNISVLINRWINLLSSHKNSSNELLIKTSDVIGFFNSPLLAFADDTASNIVNVIKNNDKYNKRYIITSTYLAEINKVIDKESEVLNILLKYNNLNPTDFLQCIIDLLNILIEKYSLKNELNQDANTSNAFELEFIFHYLTIVNRLKSLIDANKILFADSEGSTNIHIVTTLLESIVSNKFIPFEGDPLKGIQIIGFLESRSLDFDNIIILSMQDSTISSEKRYNTIIPSVIRKGFDLPSNETMDAIDSYRFYRLIGKANNVILSYNNNSDSISDSEPSRFINQLELLYGYQIKRKTLYSKTGVKKNIDICISDLEPDIQSQMNKFISEDGSLISASAINTLVRCPICFYYDYIKKIKRDQDPYMILKENEFGDILHLAMKEILKQYENGKPLTQKVYDSFIENNYIIKEYVKNAYLQCLCIDKNKTFDALDNMYIDMCLEYIKIIFEYEKALLDKYEIYYLFGEKKLRNMIKIEDLSINFTGAIDRIDIIKNKSGEYFLRIIDYKTGKYELSSKFDNFFDEIKHPKAIFQTLLYSEMISQQKNKILKDINLGCELKDIKISPCIYGTSELSINKKDAKTNIKIDNDIIFDYETIRDKFIKKFYDYIKEYFEDSENKFDENIKKSLNCNYCPISIHK